MPGSGPDRVIFSGALSRGCLIAVGRLLLLAAASVHVHAQPSVPWMPDIGVRSDIAWLSDAGGLDLVVTHWPLPRRAVRQALDRLPTSLEPGLAAARDRVRRALDADTGAQASLRLQNRDDALTGYGDDATRGSSVAVRSATLALDRLALQAGVRLDSLGGPDGRPQLRLDDTALATEALGVQWQAFAHRAWWGPGWQSSLVLGNNAPAFKGVGLQRASAGRSASPWWSWMGPWTAEMFIAQTEDVASPADPWLVGQRLTLRPFSHLELAFTRTAQWGGHGRPQGLHSFLDMLTGRGVNADSTPQQAADPANEMAGVDVRLGCPGGVRCAAYLQLIGEDRAGVLPSRYLGLYGLEAWSADGSRRFFAEYAETGCRAPVGAPFLRGCAYRNYAYPDGYTSGGRWLGASVGPDARLFTFGWVDAASGRSLRFDAGKVASRIGSFTPALIDPDTGGFLLGVSARQDLAWGPVRVVPQVDWTRVAALHGARNQWRVGATAQWGLDDTYRRGSAFLGRSLSGADADGWRPLWVGAGLVAAALVADRPVDDYVRRHADNPSGRALSHVGTALPLGALGLAGLSWAWQHGSLQGDLAGSALVAGAVAGGLAEAGKYALDRARPAAGQGAFHRASARADASFPSAHAAVAWAVLTPYAKHYDAPWLYGLAALGSAGRVASRDHWVSDAVAGAAIGYCLGDLFYRRGAADRSAPGMQVWIAPRSIRLQTAF